MLKLLVAGILLTSSPDVARSDQSFTARATVFATLGLAQEPLPASKQAQAVALNAVLDRVAARLRNTRAICRRCYVPPAVVDAWLDGRLQEEIAAIRPRARRPFKGLDADESLVLRWLDARKA